MEDAQQQKLIKPPHPHIAIVQTPGMGHLIPLVALAKRLVVHHNFNVIFFIPNDGSSVTPQKKLLEALPKTISSIFLPPVSFDDLPEDVQIETRISLTLTRSLSALRDSVKLLAESTWLVALVVDIFGADAFEVANEFHVAPYMFCPTNAMVLSFGLHLQKLDETTSGEYRDLPEPVELHGCVPIHGRDLLDPVQDRKNEAYKATLRISRKFTLASGIMVNSFMDLEPGVFKALKEGGRGFPPVYPVGPLIQSGSTGGIDGHECLTWLDRC